MNVRSWDGNNDSSVHEDEEENDSEEQEQLEDDELEEDAVLNMERELSIVAVPPKVVPHEENLLEASSSPAFHILDALYNEGKLTATKLLLLKEKYTQLHESLKKKRSNEQRLIQQAKDFSNQLAQQKYDLDKADMFPANSTSEVSQMRESLLSYHNDLAETDERLYQLHYKIHCLEEDKTLAEREYARVPKPAEVEKEMDELKSAESELRREIGHRKHEMKTLQEDVDRSTRRGQLVERELHSINQQINDINSELAAVMSVPDLLAVEFDRHERQKSEVCRKSAQLDDDVKQLHQQLLSSNDKLQQLEMEKSSVEMDLRAVEARHVDKERQCQVVVKDFDYCKERETVLRVDRATLDLNMRHVTEEMTSLGEVQQRKVREKDSELRRLKKAELQLRQARDGVQHVQQMLDNKQADVAAAPKDDGTSQKLIEELQTEVDKLKLSVTKQSMLTSQEARKIDRSVARQERLLRQQRDLETEVIELTRLAVVKRDEQAQKMSDVGRVKQHLNDVRHELSIKQTQIVEHTKKHHDLQTRLKEFAQLYDVIKNERNKCVSMIQASTQKSAEVREKLKIFDNETEILRTSIAQKEKQLQKQRTRHISSVIVRESLRTELGKQRSLADNVRETQDQARIDIDILNMMIGRAEEQMIQLRKRYEEEIQKRNERGVQLIERNEEVCIFHERVNLQEQMLRNGEVEMRARDEEIRFLNMQLAEEQRILSLMKRTLPSKKTMEEEIVALQIELAQCCDRQVELEKKIEKPDSDRVRFVEGKDLGPAELQKKIDDVEVRLADKEEQSMEKELVYQQVSRLTDRLSAQVDAGKDDTLKLAKKVNAMQTKIKEMTRQMMATVSELSMQQATAMRLQQDMTEKQALLERYYVNMDSGLPPSIDIEQEFMRQTRVNEQRQRDRQHAKLLTEHAQMFTLPDGTTTTAEPRPVAYLPSDDHDLPIPRPYGGHAPFRPTDTGANMRHIRKPVVKPVEI